MLSHGVRRTRTVTMGPGTGLALSSAGAWRVARAAWLALVALTAVSFAPAEAAPPVQLHRTEVVGLDELGTTTAVALPGAVAWDPARGTLALLGEAGAQVTRIDASRVAVSVRDAGPGVAGMLATYDPASRSYVWFDAATSELVVAGVDAEGDLLPSHRRVSVALGGAARVVGIAAGADGELFLLDEAGHRIVGVPASLWSGDGGGALRVIALGALGEGTVHGLAHDAARGRFYTLLMPNRVLVAIDAGGQLIESFDVERHALVEPRGMTVAPSSDPGDAETELSVYVVDRRRRNVEGAGALVEIDFDARVRGGNEPGLAPELPTTNVDIGFPMFTGNSVEGSTGEKPQSKVWYTGGNYWAIVQGPSGVAFYRRNGTTWQIATFTNAVLRSAGQADVKWNETTQQLFVLVYTLGGTAQLYKYNYTHATLTYTLVSGFPRTMTNPSGSETMVIEQDSTGRLWAVAAGTTTVLAYYSTSADHLTWAGPVTIETGIVDDDIASVIAFGGNKIGVAWSDQSSRWRFGFRWRNDTDDPTVWQAIEVVHTGTNQTDDHINLATDSQGRVYMIGKDVANDHRVFRRAAAGGWTTTSSAAGAEGTRGIIQVAEADNLVYIYYVRWGVTPERVQRRQASFGGSPLSFGSQVDFCQSSNNMNNPSGMKQPVPAGNTMVLASEYEVSPIRAWWNGVGNPPSGGGGPTAPNAPTGATATLLTGPVRVQVAWTAPVGGSAVSGYNVYRSTSGGAFTKLNTPLVTGTSFTDTSPGTAAVCYRVTAVGSTGLESTPSNEPCTDTRAAGPPQNATAQLLTGPVRTNVAWQVPTVGIASGYNVYRSVDGGAFTKLNVAAITTLSYVDTSPPTGQLCYHVTAIAATTGAESAPSNAPCVDTRAPGAPLNLYAQMRLRPPVEAELDLPFDNGSGQVATDLSGNNLHGRLGTSTGADAADPTWVAGQSGGALQFDGSADFVEVPDSPVFDAPGSFTWEAWVKRTTTSSQGCIFNKGQTDDQTIRVTVSSSGGVTFRWENTGTTRFESSVSSAIANTNWNHLAFVYDQAAGQHRIYVNGVLRSTLAANGVPNVSAEPLHIGGRLSGSSMTNFFGGAIDGLQYHHEARYTSDFTPSAPAPAFTGFSAGEPNLAFGGATGRQTADLGDGGIALAAAGGSGGVTVFAVGDTTVHLGWQPPSSGGATAGYQVFRSFNGGAFTQIGPSSVVDTTFTDSLSALGQRCYQVYAVNAIGTQGAASNTACEAFGLPPVVVAPATADGAENALVTFEVTASDLDNEPITSLTANFDDLPAGHGATFTPSPGNASGTFAWTPSFTHAGGPYRVIFTASNSFSGADTTLITIANTDRAPVVVSPASVIAAEERLLSFGVRASDPDGDAITQVTADLSALPGSPAFTPVGTDSGTVDWTPPLGGVTGPYLVTFTASNVLTSAPDTTTILIDFPPVVDAPANPGGAENTLIEFTVTASDAEAITSLTALDLPAGATFVPNGTNTSGQFSWTPGFDVAPGDFVVRFVATNALADTATSTVTVTNTDRAPVVVVPADPTGDENAPLAFTVTASDPDGDAITSLSHLGLPAGATFTPNGTNTSGEFAWTPGFADAGSHVVTFVATNALADSSTTTIVITNVDRAPVVVATPNESATEGQPFAMTVTASDPDGDALTTLEALGLPAGATFTPNGSNTSGDLAWTPDFAAAPGPYVVAFRAANALADTASTSIAVTQVDVAPEVTAPAAHSVAEGQALEFSVTASDFDGDALTDLVMLDGPAGASFTPNGTFTSGLFSWTPGFDVAPGLYPVRFVAVNALQDTATTTIEVTNTDRAPSVTPGYGPKSPAVTETENLTFTVTVADADGDAIGDLQALDLPPGATFTPNGTNTSGEFSWTPGYDAAPGPYVVRFFASNALAETATVVISVNNLDRAPVVAATASETVDENQNLAFTVTASDPDAGETITSLTAVGLPAGATFTPNGTNTSGEFSWTPGFTQSGPYTVHFIATNALADTASTSITANHVDRAPVVSGPTNPSVVETQLLQFDVTVSHPDADPIASLFMIDYPPAATFTSHGPKNLGATFAWTPSYDDAGTHVVRFIATGFNGLSDTLVTTIDVQNLDRLPVVTSPANETATEGENLTFIVGSSDDDDDPIALSALDLPPGATFTPLAAARSVGTNLGPSGEFSWTPDFSAAPGPYVVRFVATTANGADTASTTIDVTQVDVAPVVVAPPTRSAPEGVTTTITITASDFDGDAITALEAFDLPGGATFTPNGSNTSGDLVWTPAFGTPAGPYVVTFIATANGAADTATTSITVTDVDRPPVVTASASESVAEGATLEFTITAVDPDGETITTLTASGLPPGATFTPSGDNGSAAIAYTPGFAVAPAQFTATFIATNALADTASTTITVTNTDRAPVVTSSPSLNVAEGDLVEFTVTAADPDGDAIGALASPNLPAGATFVPNGANTSGQFSWLVGFDQTGVYDVRFVASNDLTGADTTHIEVANTDRAPVVTAPANRSASEDVLHTFDVTVADPDLDGITSLVAQNLPSGATFTPSGDNTSGTFSWTPDFDTAPGPYVVTFIATNALADTAETSILVADFDRAPIVTAPATETATEGQPLTFVVGSSDPDGAPDPALTALDLPPGATFTPIGAARSVGTNGGPSAEFAWTPDFSAAPGPYVVRFIAANALADTTTTTIHVTQVDVAPVVTAPETRTAPEGVLTSFAVTVADFDGDAITVLEALDAPVGATFTPNGSNTSGQFSWTPAFGLAPGQYDVRFRAVANGVADTATTAITVTDVDRAPEVTATASETVAENALLTFTVTATDPDGQAIGSLTAIGLPAGASFTPSGDNASGEFSWTPDFTQSGVHVVRFRAANDLADTAATSITVTNVDRAPIVVAQATANGAENSNLTFVVTASDPDGQAITSFTMSGAPGATFTPNGSNTSGTFSWTPSFSQAGPYEAIFTASNALVGRDTTAITIANTDRAPVVTVTPPTTTVVEGQPVTVNVSAADPDGEAITTFTPDLSGLPASATFTPSGPTAGTLNWTPGAADVRGAPYVATFTAQNALQGVGTASITVNTAIVNLVPNFSFETTLAGWNLTGPGTLSRVAGGHHGSWSAQIQSSSTSSVGLNDSPSFLTDLTAGTRYRLQAWVRSVAHSGLARIRVREYTSGGSSVFSIYSTGVNLTPEWQLLTIDYEVRGNGNYIDFNVMYSPNASNERILIDDLQVYVVPEVTVPPSVSAPSLVSATEGQEVVIAVTASDPDGPITTLAFSGSLPGGNDASFTVNASRTEGTFRWTPTFADAGSYTVTFTASNAQSGSASTTIQVGNVDRAPVVTAPAFHPLVAGVLIELPLTAIDPDGDPIVNWGAQPTPGDATLTIDGPTTATFRWTPDTDEAAAGPYAIEFIASNALTGRDTTLIAAPQPPVVTAPAAISVDEGATLTFPVTAADIDGPAIASFDGAPLPAGATFTTNPAKTNGTFAWTPGFAAAGVYDVVFTASNDLTGRDTTRITVVNVDRPPMVVASPSTASVVEGQTVTIVVAVNDPDGEAIVSLTATDLPPGATFTPNGDFTAGTFTWTTNASHVRTPPYVVTFTATNALTGTRTASITVNSAVVNLVSNFSFETSTSGWNSSSSSLTRVAGGHHGSWAAQLASSSTSTFGLNDSPNLLTNLVAGQRYRFQAWVRSVAHTGLARIRVREYDDGDLEESVFSTGVNLSPTWQLLTLEHVVTRTGNYIDFQVLNRPNVSSERFLVDDILIQLVPDVPVDRAPVVNAPATRSLVADTPISFLVTASDPDGEPITSWTTSPLPPGATFTPDASMAFGTFAWTPQASDLPGPYSIVFTASNALSASDTTRIFNDRAPVVVSPASRTVAEGSLLTFTVTATDPDGDLITSLTAAGLPSGATFTPNGSNTSATFSWTPGFTAAGGPYEVIFVGANDLSGRDTTVIMVTNTDRAPVVVATPPTVSVLEGQQATVTVNASDPDGQPVTLVALLGGLPPSHGAQFTPTGPASGTLTWTPSAGHGRPEPYPAIFEASNDLTGRDTTLITVSEAVANLVGNPGFEANLNGWERYNSTLARVAGGRSGSFCLEVRGPSSASSFGVDDNPDVVNPVAGAGAVYKFSAWVRSAAHVGKVRLRIYEYAGNTQIGSTFYSGEVTLAPAWKELSVFYTVRQAGTRLSLRITDIAAASNEIFQVDDVSIELISTGAILAGEAKEDTLVRRSGVEPTNPGGDAIPDRFEAAMGPNPLAGRGHLTLALPQATHVRADLFDPMGRRVRSLVDGHAMAAGRHSIPVDAAGGGRLQPGVYLWRVQAGAETRHGRIVVTP